MPARLNWTAPADGGSAITGYQLERSRAGAAYSLLVSQPGTQYVDSAAIAGDSYRVRAVNAVGPGPYSNLSAFSAATTITLAADGTDQTASLQSQIDAAANGATDATRTVLLLPTAPAGYRIDGTILLASRQNLTITTAGGGTFLHYSDLTGLDLGLINGGATPTSRRQHWMISACTNVTLSHVTVRGPNSERDATVTFALYRSDLAFEHAFAIQGASKNVLAENLGFSNVYGDGVYVGGTGASNQNITVRNVLGTYTGRQQLACVNGTDVLFEDCDVRWGGRSGFDLEPNHDTHYVTRLTLRRLTMGSKSYPFVLGGDAGDGLIHNTDVVLEDCVGLNAASSHPALLTRPGHNITIRRHVDLRQRSTIGLSFNGTTGTVIVEDCEIASGPSTPTSYGIQIAGNSTAAYVIRNNTFNGQSGAVGTGGADQLYELQAGSVPASITTCGNVWNMGGSNDGVCP